MVSQEPDELGENLENLHRLPADPEELECKRSAPNSLLNSVQHENLEDFPRAPPPPPRSPAIIRRISGSENTLEATTASPYPGFGGTSTNCSANCGGRLSTRRSGALSGKTLGTSIAWCEDRVSTFRSTSNSWSSICGSSTSSSGYVKTSTFCFAVRRRARSCGLTSRSRSGRAASTPTPSSR